MKKLWIFCKKLTGLWTLWTSTCVGEIDLISSCFSITWDYVTKNCRCLKSAHHASNKLLRICQATNLVFKKNRFRTVWRNLAYYANLKCNTVQSCHKSIAIKMPCLKLKKVCNYRTSWSQISNNCVSFMSREKKLKSISLVCLLIEKRPTTIRILQVHQPMEAVKDQQERKVSASIWVNMILSIVTKNSLDQIHNLNHNKN